MIQSASNDQLAAKRKCKATCLKENFLWILEQLATTTTTIVKTANTGSRTVQGEKQSKSLLEKDNN
jgi:hypothetical protein